MKLICYCVLCLLALPLSSYGSHLEKSRHNIQFGGALNTGNSQTKNLSTKIESEVQHEPWGYEASLAGQVNTSQGIESARSVKAQGEVNYDLSHKTYLFFKSRVVYDKFTTYDFLVQEALGLGRILLQNKNHELSVEAGPGGTHRRISGTKQYQNTPIINLDGKYIGHISETAEFKQTLSIDISRQNTHSESNSAIRTKVIEHLALELSINISHDSVIPPLSRNTKKTDTASKATIVYTF